MSSKYKIGDQDKAYFVTFAVVNWIPGLGRKECKEIFLESLKYCQENKGLEVYAWVLMDNHVHMVLGRNGEEKLEDIVRDIKKYPAVQDVCCRASAMCDARLYWGSATPSSPLARNLVPCFRCTDEETGWQDYGMMMSNPISGRFPLFQMFRRALP